MPLTICYHGTDEAHARIIEKEGFHARTHFAQNLQDALGYGGEFIFEVVFEGPINNWQFVEREPVPVDRIVAHYQLSKIDFFDNPTLRKRVFDSNP